ncbi:MAG: hypothetical protein ACLQHF_00010 [Terracidiphilus sp.]
MSLLQHDTTELDDAAKGEEYTKGTTQLGKAVIISTIAISIAIFFYIYAGEKPPLATGEVLNMWAHPIHTETSGFDANGAPMVKETFDQMFVFTQVRLHNQSKVPLFLVNVLTNLAEQGKLTSSYAANKGDYGRIWVAYPDLQIPHGPALSPLDTEIQPGQTVEGTVVSAFQMTRQEWDARKGLDLTFSFRYQPSLTLTPHAAVIDR